MADILDDKNKSVADGLPEDELVNDPNVLDGNADGSKVTPTETAVSSRDTEGAVLTEPDVVEEIESQGCDTLLGPEGGTTPENVPDNQEQNDLGLENKNVSDAKGSGPQSSNNEDDEEFDLFKELESYKSQVDADFPENSDSGVNKDSVDWSETADELLQQLPTETRSASEESKIQSISKELNEGESEAVCDINEEKQVYPQEENESIDNDTEPHKESLHDINEDNACKCVGSPESKIQGSDDTSGFTETSEVQESAGATNDNQIPVSVMALSQEMVEPQRSGEVDSSQNSLEDTCGSVNAEGQGEQDNEAIKTPETAENSEEKENATATKETSENIKEKEQSVTDEVVMDVDDEPRFSQNLVSEHDAMCFEDSGPKSEKVSPSDEPNMSHPVDNKQGQDDSVEDLIDSVENDKTNLSSTGKNNEITVVNNVDEKMEVDACFDDQAVVVLDEDIINEKAAQGVDATLHESNTGEKNTDLSASNLNVDETGVDEKNRDSPVVSESKACEKNVDSLTTGDMDGQASDIGTQAAVVSIVDDEDTADQSLADKVVVNLDDEESKENDEKDDTVVNDKSDKGEIVVNLDEEPDKELEKSPGQIVKENEAKITTQSKSDSSKESKSKSQKCIVCQKVGKCKYNIVRNGDIKHLCDDKCFKVFRSHPTCYLKGKNDQTANGGKAIDTSTCSNCHSAIPALGKYTLRKKGNGKKNFCKESCKAEYEQSHGICAFCYCDLSSAVAALKVTGPGGKLQDVCSKECQIQYEAEFKKTSNDKTENDVEIVGTSNVPKTGARTRRQSMVTCSVCGTLSNPKHEIEFNKTINKLCSDACFSAFRYANKLAITACDNCKKPCGDTNSNTIQFMGNTKRFCGAVCLNSFKTKNQKILACQWCQAKKSNFDMVERVDTNNKTQLFCSLNCLSLYRVNLQATSNQSVTCDHCKKFAPAQYHLTMSDASVRNFCAYSCVMAFQAQFQQPQASGKNQAAPTTQSKRGRTTRQTRVSSKTASIPVTVPAAGVTPTSNSMPFIHDVVSLAANEAAKNKVVTQSPKTNVVSSPSTPNQQATAPQRVITKTVKETTTQTKVMVQPIQPKTSKNKSVLCKPFTQTKATSCRPHAQSKEVQTEEDFEKKATLIPVPVPVYVPVPMAMYNIPVPYPVPLPIPIPVPCFIPTTKKSAASIMKQIEKIQSSMPADPFEAELLSMAAAVAGDDRASSSDTEDEESTEPAPVPIQEVEKTQPPEESTDVLQMAFQMASGFTAETVLDMEDNVAPMPVNPGNAPVPQYSPMEPMMTETPRRGRGKRRGGSTGSRQTRSSKKMKIEDEVTPPAPIEVAPQEPPPDENMVLKFTYGVNAWKHWVAQKNQQLERTATRSRRQKMYKADILACTADELNFQLCQFVQEVRKPNGEEYAPDSIYYLCLGIQEYLYENGRIDNIFTDLYYEQFNENLNQVIIKYEVRLNAQGLIVCRIEEEHLWESKQLGAHSPYVLLNTLIYFNTRFFMLRTPEEHLRLSFSHIMKHWKKTNLPVGKQGGRSVYLRYYAPQHQADINQKRKRDDLPIYEQGENIDNPLRCPVKLYEFYLSKCPESIKNRNDVFYLTPERSCVPDSPVWYSTLPLGKDIMARMLNRLQVVKEIQEAHLAYQPGVMM